MRERRNAFHLAIPARDLDEMQQFYVDGLGCHLARRYPDRITLDFFGDQVVCHLSDDWDGRSLTPSSSSPRPATSPCSPRCNPGSRTGSRSI
jgi:extradiol dioxygenase family protein